MGRRWRWAVPGAIAVLALCFVFAGDWFFAVRSSSAGRSEPAPDPKAGTVVEPRLEKPAGTGEEADRRAPAERAAELRVRVQSKDGTPVKGSVFWRTGLRPPVTSDLLAQNRESEPRVQSMEHTGLARLRVPSTHWTWLRVVAHGTGGRSVGAFRRVPPFEGEKEVVVDLDHPEARLHVFLLDSDLVTPAAERDVRLYVRSLHSDGQPRLHATGRTDKWGYVVFDDLPEGGQMVCAPGARIGDPPPYTSYTIVAQPQSAMELPVTLVVPEEKVELRLQVTAHVEKHQSPPAPRLVLERQDGGRELRFPVRDALKPGVHEYRVGVPPGRYCVRGLPQGALQILDEGKTVDVHRGENRVFRVSVMATSAKTKVRLVGLARSCFPVQVSVLQPGAFLDDPKSLSFLGPYRWQTAEQYVGGSWQQARLTAFANIGVWTSAAPVTLAGGDVSVEMIPATRIELRWIAADAGVKAWAELKSSSGTQLVVLARQLVGRNGRMESCLVGRAVVPRGKLRIEGLDARTASPAWVREIQATRPYEVVRVVE